MAILWVACRLQVLTPLSLLINIATVLVCTIVVWPGIGALYLLTSESTGLTFDHIGFGIGGVTKAHPSSISPQPFLIAIYVVAIYAGQIGYCILLVFANKPETKVGLQISCCWRSQTIVNIESSR
jgi:hypothetical protein